MKWRIKKMFVLLKGQGVLFTAGLSLTAMVLQVILFASTLEEKHFLYAVLFALLFAWIVCDAHQANRIGALQNQVADLKDKLCLNEHETERLRMEVDIYKEAEAGRKAARNAKRKKNENQN